MGRIIAIDYGKKRVGLATTDPLQIIATGLPTVLTKEVLPFLKQYFKEEVVDRIVIGDGKDLNGDDSHIAGALKEFIVRLNKIAPEIPVIRVDENYTSKRAKESMIASGMKKKKRRDKSLVDEISAVIILQSYLASEDY